MNRKQEREKTRMTKVPFCISEQNWQYVKNIYREPKYRAKSSENERPPESNPVPNSIVWGGLRLHPNAYSITVRIGEHSFNPQPTARNLTKPPTTLRLGFQKLPPQSGSGVVLDSTRAVL
jgi:hypothetical protein